MTKIYLAGPLFTQGEWIWNEMLADLLSKLDIQVLLPQERAISMLSGDEEYDPSILFDHNIQSLKESDVVVAIFDQADPDSGTSWECGFAYSLNIPIIGLRTDLRRVGDDTDASINLMLSKSCRAFLDIPFNNRNNVQWIADKLAEHIKAIS